MKPCCVIQTRPVFVLSEITRLPLLSTHSHTGPTVFGAAGIASLSGRVIGGLAADRIGAKRMIIFGLALQALSVSLYVFTRDLSSFYGLALMFGFSYGAVMPLYAILVREYFGARIMGTMFGAVNMASTLGMAIGPWAGGWLYDVYAAISGSISARLASVSERSQSPSLSARRAKFWSGCRARASRKARSSFAPSRTAARVLSPPPGPATILQDIGGLS